jgi:hypothetical protein
MKPLLDYAGMVKIREPAEFRFTGKYESFSGKSVLWVRSGDLTVPVDLRGAQTFLLPSGGEGDSPAFDPETEVPLRIRWDSLSTLTGETKVFVGGTLVMEDKRPIFASSPESSLFVIFYEGSGHSLTLRTIRAGRDRNAYFNFITPYAFILGAFCQILIALTYLTRPALRPVMAMALTAIFAPLFPLLPPGLIFTMAARTFRWRARLYSAYRDLALLPLRYFPPGSDNGRLPGGETYVVRRYGNLLPAIHERELPLIIPPEGKHLGEIWHVFGVLPEGGGETFPAKPSDGFAVYGAYPGDPSVLARRYNSHAHRNEFISAFLALASLAVNIYLILLVFRFLGS